MIVGPSGFSCLIKKDLAEKTPSQEKTFPNADACWVLPEDLCKKDPCNFNTEMFVSKVGNPCPALGLDDLASRILYALLVGEKNSTKSPGRDFVHGGVLL